MNGIQKKSLEHVSETLGSIDSYEAYRAILKALNDQGSKEDVLNAYQEAVSSQFEKAEQAKEWVDVLIKDAG